MNPYEAPLIAQNQGPEPKTGAQAPSPGIRRRTGGAVLLALMPMLLILPAYVFWLLMWIKLGHPPIPYRDDPKQLGELASFLHNQVILLTIAAVMFAVVDSLLFVGILFVRFSTLSFRLQLLGIHLVSSAIVLLLPRLDPFRVFEWLAD